MRDVGFDCCWHFVVRSPGVCLLISSIFFRSQWKVKLISAAHTAWLPRVITLRHTQLGASSKNPAAWLGMNNSSVSIKWAVTLLLLLLLSWLYFWTDVNMAGLDHHPNSQPMDAFFKLCYTILRSMMQIWFGSLSLLNNSPFFYSSLKPCFCLGLAEHAPVCKLFSLSRRQSLCQQSSVSDRVSLKPAEPRKLLLDVWMDWVPL